jgi:hypothetical protein
MTGKTPYHIQQRLQSTSSDHWRDAYLSLPAPLTSISAPLTDNMAASTDNTGALNDVKPFRFLALPAEIRLQIYQILHRNRESIREVYSRMWPDLSSQLLRVCHKIHVKATPVLHEQNNFDIGRHYVRWADRILSEENFKMVKHLTLGVIARANDLVSIDDTTLTVFGRL